MPSFQVWLFKTHCQTTVTAAQEIFSTLGSEEQTNQYSFYKILYWINLSDTPPGFILYHCINVEQMTRKMTLNVSDPGRWQDKIAFSIYGKKQWLNRNSLHKCCNLWGLFEVIKITIKLIHGSKTLGITNKDLSDLVEWSLLVTLYELQKTFLTHFDK